MLWLGFALAWGTQRLYAIRLAPDLSIRDEENTWGFGQLVPVFLMAIPILSVGQSYFGKILFLVLQNYSWCKCSSSGFYLHE